jgi:hypothetical protein
VRCGDITIEAFLFPSENQLEEFMEVIGTDPWWIPYGNVILHFPESHPAAVEEILKAIEQTK